MSVENCTTHHYACECREAKFAEIARGNETLRDDLDNAHHTIRGMEIQQERIEQENAALLKRLEASDDWDDYSAIKELQRENAALRAALTPWLAWENTNDDISSSAARHLCRIARAALGATGKERHD